MLFNDNVRLNNLSILMSEVLLIIKPLTTKHKRALTMLLFFIASGIFNLKISLFPTENLIISLRCYHIINNK